MRTSVSASVSSKRVRGPSSNSSTSSARSCRTTVDFSSAPSNKSVGCTHRMKGLFAGFVSADPIVADPQIPRETARTLDWEAPPALAASTNSRISPTGISCDIPDASKMATALVQTRNSCVALANSGRLSPVAPESPKSNVICSSASPWSGSVCTNERNDSSLSWSAPPPCLSKIESLLSPVLRAAAFSAFRADSKEAFVFSACMVRICSATTETFFSFAETWDLRDMILTRLCKMPWPAPLLLSCDFSRVSTAFAAPAKDFIASSASLFIVSISMMPLSLFLKVAIPWTPSRTLVALTSALCTTAVTSSSAFVK
mmetsp:Transcript_16306/g.44276  ORF Transcript_16306/g.44276 Transcript_16306/m.44276 type:complete len:315 (-) Transcript_16306:2413-3357(-)